MNNNNSIEKFVRENAIMMVQENPNHRGKMYKCKDCNKEYDNFQALGGHRASHRRFRQRNAGDKNELVLHACKICRKEFESGQSLGGHMRTHYHKYSPKTNELTSLVTLATNSFASSSSSSNSVSILCLIEGKDLNGNVVFEYDLNLTPVENEKAIRGISSYI